MAGRWRPIRRRPVDVGTCAAAIVAAEGWVVLGRVGEEVGRAAREKGRSEADERVSLVVTGGGLRGQAVLTVARAGARSGRRPDGVVSSHLPRSLPPPEGRRARRGEVELHLREHPGRGTLDHLLSGTGRLTAGEAVTVLAAVARCVADLHASGLGGVGLRPADIGFRDDGCPMLTAVDHLRSLDQQTMGEDVAAFAELAATLCRAVDHERGGIVLAAATDRRHRGWEDVIAGVLRVADPTAVRWVDPDAQDRAGPRARGDPGGHPFGGPGGDHSGGDLLGGAAGDPIARVERAASRRERRGGGGGRDVLGVAEWAFDYLGDRPVARASAALREWVAGRPKVVAVACSPLLATVLVLVLIPGQDGPG